MTITQRLHAAERQRDEAVSEMHRRVSDVMKQSEAVQQAAKDATDRMQDNLRTHAKEIMHLREMLTRLAHGGVHIETMKTV